MKFLIFFILNVVALASAGGGHGPPMFRYLEECQGSASNADMAAIMSHALTLPEPAYCVLGCAMKKAGMMTTTNKIDMDNIKTSFASAQPKHPEVHQKMIAIFESCQPSGTPSSECQGAKQIYECTEPKIKELFPRPPKAPQ